MTHEDLVPRGDCYRASFNYVAENCAKAGIRLVQAVCLIGTGPHEGLPYGHAWVEYPHPEVPLVVCRDVEKKYETIQALFYMGGRPTQIHRYTFREASKWAFETGVYGPWELKVDR